MKKNYLYIGQYYHIRNKSLPNDFKVGVTNNLKIREYSLGTTKSPIKYIILRAWEIPPSLNRTQVEKLIELIFNDSKYDGCEWYDYDEVEFQDKIQKLFEILNNMNISNEINFVEVDLNQKTNTEDILESSIRENKKSEWSNLKVLIEDHTFQNKFASETFSNSIQVLVDKFGVDEVIMNFPDIVKIRKEDFPTYKQNQLREINGVFVDCHSSTDTKIKKLKLMCNFFGVNYIIEKV